MLAGRYPVSLLHRFRLLVQAYPPLLWLVGGVALLNWFGFSFVWPVISVLIHDHLGRPMAVAGLVLLLNSAGGTLGSLTAGWWFDRAGPRPVLLTALVGSAVLAALLGTVTNWPLFVATMCAYGFTTMMPFPALNALAARAWPAGGRRAFSFLYVLGNLGVAAGVAVGGLLAAVSFTVAFLTSAAIGLLAAILVLVGIRAPRPAASAQTPGGKARIAGGRPLPWLPIGALSLGLLTCWAVYMQWQGPVAVHLQAQGIGLPRYSLLWTLNGLVIVLGQPLLSLGLRRLPSLWAQLVLGVCLYAGSFGLLARGAFYPALVAGIVCLTLGEMLIHPGVPAAVDQLAPPERRGFLQGLIGSAATVGRMVGPLAGGVIFDRLGFNAIPRAALVVLAVPFTAFLLYGLTRNKQKEMHHAET